MLNSDVWGITPRFSRNGRGRKQKAAVGEKGGSVIGGRIDRSNSGNKILYLGRNTYFIKCHFNREVKDALLGAGNGMLFGVPERSANSPFEVLTMSAAITRILKLAKGQGQQDVPVRLFWPVADEHAWGCRWEIDWPDRQRSNSGRGIDGFQALENALQMIGTEIYCSEEHRSDRLAWTDDWSGYGFPVPKNIRDLLIGDDAKNF